jgi:hypothetical protein
VRNRGEAETQVYQTATAGVFSIIGEEAANKAARIARHLGEGAGNLFGEPRKQPLLLEHRKRRSVRSCADPGKLACRQRSHL